MKMWFPYQKITEKINIWDGDGDSSQERGFLIWFLKKDHNGFNIE